MAAQNLTTISALAKELGLFPMPLLRFINEDFGSNIGLKRYGLS
jgi:hypothetical protein